MWKPEVIFFKYEKEADMCQLKQQCHPTAWHGMAENRY
jgi:hypothetical protein